MADNTEGDDAPKGRPWETAATIKQEWTPKDVELLRSGQHADAVVICKDKTSREVHRGILSSRSKWFKKAFDNADMEDGTYKIEIDEDSWGIDLILHFFYVGYIDMAEDFLSRGYSEAMLGVRMVGLADTLREKTMLDYGYNLLNTHLSRLVEYICDPNATAQDNDYRFNEVNDVSDFVAHILMAVQIAFDTERPVKLAQGLLAAFAFSARSHLFKNQAFVSFIRMQVAPEFGSMVLLFLMPGARDGSLESQALQSWQLSPVSEQPEHSSVDSLSRTPSPGYYPGLVSSTGSVDSSENSH